MKFTDVFIKRPVMGIALSIILMVLGLFGLTRMSTSEYPKVESAAIRVTVNQTGTSAQSIQNFITQPLESALASVEDVDYISSNSTEGNSVITLMFRAGTNIDNAYNNVLASVNTAKKNLPQTADDPIVIKDTGQAINPLYLAFKSEQLDSGQLTDYLDRNIKPIFYTVNGVANVEFFTPGLNLLITLDPEKIAKYNLSPAVVSQVISANNLQVSAGSLKSTYRVLTNSINGTVKDLEELKNLIIRTNGLDTVRLKDIANVTLEKIEGVAEATYGNKPVVVMTFSLTPSANALTVVENLVKVYKNQVVSALPNYVESEITYDGTEAVRSSIEKVISTVFEAALIVMIVMLLFLGSIKSLIVPIIAIPISIVANFIFLYAMGYTLNMITLLAMILSIGLVVDDAIVVLENIHRHIKLGETPFRAAIIGTREIAAPVIVMTFTLAVVFLPIALSSGPTGPIYKEFAITLSGSVILSGVVSLTLSPMLVAYLYRNYNPQKVPKFEHLIDHTLDKYTNSYVGRLQAVMARPKTIIVLLASIGFAIVSVPSATVSELTPTEDRGLLVSFAQVPENSTLEYSKLAANEISKRIDGIPEIDKRLTVILPGQIINIAPLNLERDRTQNEIVQDANTRLSDMVGTRAQAINFPEIQVPGSGFTNFSVAIQSNKSYQQMQPLVDKFLEAAKEKGIVLFGFSDVRFNKSKLEVNINRDKAAELGVNVSNIAQSMASYLSGGVAARVSLEGKVYNVITRLADQEKNATTDLSNFYVQNSKGQNIPLSELVTYEITSQPSANPRLNQLNTITISGFSLQAQGDMVSWVQDNFSNYFPSDFTYTFIGDLRNYVTEGNANNVIFAMAFIMIFLVLAIQFNSWRDGIVIMITVPLAVSGSLVTLYLLSLLKIPGATMNLYTKIGILTLVGLITKHGILMCEVAREEQIFHGLSRKNAIIRAARLRFRPILMTTLAMIAGLIPLLMSSGTGANARFSIALVIVSGLSIGTLFTLFILPTIYTFIGKIHKPAPEFDESIPPIEDNEELHDITTNSNHKRRDGQGLNFDKREDKED